MFGTQGGIAFQCAAGWSGAIGLVRETGSRHAPRMISPMTRRRWIVSTSACLAFGSAPMLNAAEGGSSYWAYFGTYTGAKSKGIYAAEYDAGTGTVGSPKLVAELPNPTFLAVHPSGKFLYAVGEVGDFEGKKGGVIRGFSINPASGELKPINSQSTLGGGPCHVSLDPGGKVALVANYGGGSVASYSVAPNGMLSEAKSFIQHSGSSVNPGRQKEPHAHSINASKDGRFAVAADLGIDKVNVYKVDAANGTLAPNQPAFVSVKPGSGPRHFAFHPDGRHAFVINELLSTLTLFRYDATAGVLTEVQTVSTLPVDVKGGSTAEVVVHPSGKFVYGSNRGHDSIAIFRFDAAKQSLTPGGHVKTGGRTPRNFALDPKGNHLLACNQGSDSVFVFKVDQSTGALEATGAKLEIGSPVCVRFAPRSN